MESEQRLLSTWVEMGKPGETARVVRVRGSQGARSLAACFRGGGFERQAWLPNLALPSSLGLTLRDQRVLQAVGQLQ